jgi:hypothetical protein
VLLRGHRLHFHAAAGRRTPVLLKGDVKRAGRMPALQGKLPAFFVFPFRSEFSSPGVDAIERVGGGFLRWGSGSRRLRSGVRFPGEIEK